MVKQEFEKKVAEMQRSFKEDILKVDGLRKEALSKAESFKGKYAKAAAQIVELKEVLQMAADADMRKDALVEEVRASAKEAKEKLDRERDLLTRE